MFATSASPPPLMPIPAKKNKRGSISEMMMGASNNKKSGGSNTGKKSNVNKSNRSLGAALASISSKDSRSSGRHVGGGFGDEPIEAGIGVGHFENEDLSVQQDAPTKGRKQPKRASLLDKSQEFKDKFVKFMQDYDTGNPNYNDLEESNRFPTREVDLRHVDQGINLMDASSARHEWREDEEAAEYNYADDGYNDDDDVYDNYTQGYTSSSGGGDGDDEKKQLPGCGGIKLAIEREESEKTASSKDWGPTYSKKKDNCCETGLTSSYCMVLVMVCLSILLVYSLPMFHGVEEYSTVTPTSPPTQSVPAVPEDVVDATKAVTHPLGTTEGDVNRRRLVLEHVLGESLLRGNHDPDLDLHKPDAKKAVTWMTEYDKKSMELLDNFSYHSERGRQLQYHEGPHEVTHVTLEKEDIDNPNNHAREIMDRYVEAVFYFKENPEASPSACGLK